MVSRCRLRRKKPRRNRGVSRNVIPTPYRGTEQAPDGIQWFQIHFPVLFDAERVVANEYGAYILPYTFLLDQEGTAVKKFLGAVDWMDKENVAMIEGMLK